MIVFEYCLRYFIIFDKKINRMIAKLIISVNISIVKGTVSVEVYLHAKTQCPNDSRAFKIFI